MIISHQHHKDDQQVGKVLKFVRHGQAYHNSLGDANIRDPKLTPKGIEQSRRVPSLFTVEQEDNYTLQLNNLEFNKYLIIVSPLKRTIETAIYALASQFRNENCKTLKDCIQLLYKFNIKLILQPLLQERAAGKLPCDTGVELTQLEEEFFQNEFNIFNSTFLESKWYEPKMELSTRVEKFKSWIGNFKENNFIVFTHHGFLMELTNGIEFENCEMKKYLLIENNLIPII